MNRIDHLEKSLRSENFNRPQYYYGLRLLQKHNPQQKRVIEFGAGRGEFSRILKEKGYSVVFSDINAENVQWAQSIGFEAHIDDLNQPMSRYADASFDGAVLLEVIEHIPYAERLLSELRRIIKPNGFILLSTPNPYFLTHRLRVLLGKPIVGDGYHFRYFTYLSLKKILKEHQFEIAEEMHSTATFGINALLKLIKKKYIELCFPKILYGLLARKFYLIAIKK